MADYLTFEFNMITHGRGYLFDEKGGCDALTKGRQWEVFDFNEIFEIKKRILQ